MANTSRTGATAPTPTIIPMPTGRARTRCVNQAKHVQEQDSLALARKLGMVAVNPNEQMLLDRLRFTTYAGRELIYEMAALVQKRHPWVDGQLEQNTAKAL